MGYYTRFELHAYDAKSKYPIPEELEQEISQKIWEITGGSSRYTPYNFEDCFEETMKWYKHENDMCTISQEYPNIIFVLEGVGEEFPDSWRKWFYNGIVEASYAEIVYPQPDNPLFAEFNF